MEDAVRPRHLEAPGGRAVGIVPVPGAGVVEREREASVFVNAPALERGRIGDDVGEAVDVLERVKREAAADRLLMVLVDVVHVREVARDGERGVLLIGGVLRLRLLDLEPALPERRELHDVELERGIFERLCPRVVQVAQFRVVSPAVIGVAATLVPDEAAVGHRREGRHHAVPHAARAVRIPRLDRGAAPAGVHDRDRDAGRVVDGERVIEGDGREEPLRVEANAHADGFVPEALRGEVVPGDLAVERGLGHVHLRHGGEADAGTACERGHQDAVAVAVAGVAAQDGLLHVALAGGEPHLAHQHVPDRRLLGAAGDDEFAPLGARFERLEIDAPRARRVGLRALALSRESHHDLPARVRSAPHRHLHAALEHHAVAKRRGRPERGLGRAPGGAERSRNQCFADVHVRMIPKPSPARQLRFRWRSGG